MRLAGALGPVIAVSLAVASASAAPSASTGLPRARQGPVVPSAGGVVLGASTRAQAIARWGRPNRCWVVADGCAWASVRATARGGRVETDTVTINNLARGGIVHYVSFESRSWRSSKLRGWRTPEGVRIGTPYPTLKRAYPGIKWNLGEAANRNRSNWLFTRYTHDGGEYSLRFLVDRGLPQVNAGRILRIEIQWFGRPLACTLSSVAERGAEGEPVGRRIRGSCSGAGLARELERSRTGRVSPLTLTFNGVDGSEIASAASTTCTVGRGSFGTVVAACPSGPDTWPVDVLLGFGSTAAAVAVEVRQPSSGVAPGAANLRFQLR